MEYISFEHNNIAADLVKQAYDTPPLAFVHSYGCQQNVNDGERIKGVLMDIGYGLCDKPEDADLILFNTWKGVGYNTVVYLAAIAGIDAEIYEAAEIDGASVMQRIFRITIPSLIPTMITLLLLSIGGIFYGNFDMFWNLIGSNSLLYDTTDVIDTYVYRGLMQLSNIGMSSAAGLYQSFVGFLFVLTANLIVRKISKEDALF